ncbi:MAG: hypothetical protein KDA28_04560, partial [Phycisphaerales bacterium]|nr:hypothetical protein [Phycisphaerales bacterium]
AYTASKPEAGFVYRDALWSGADMLGVGVSSISHLGGVNFQNEHQFDPYVERVESGELPVKRALELSNEERFIREFILQMKLGTNPLEQYRERFGIDPASRYGRELEALETRGMLKVDEDAIRLDRGGLLQVDGMLPDFYLERHRDARYA